MTPVLAIVGAAESPSQDTGDLTPVGLMAEAASVALGQTGLTIGEVDGLFSASAYHHMPTVTLGEYLAVRPRYSDSTTIGGASFVSHLHHAASAISSGACDVGLIAYGSTQRSDGRSLRSLMEPLAYEAPYGALWPIAGYAMMAQRHMHEFGTRLEDLAEVAVAARGWAQLNPDASRREPLTIDDVMASPVVSSPLRRADCCLVSNGGGALVVVHPDRAADLCEHPIYLLGSAEGHWSRNVSAIADLTTSPAADTGPRALAAAGVSITDIDVFGIYDSFTIAVLISLESLGLCPPGEAGRFVRGGTLGPGGTLAVNTSGGGLSCRHPGMLGMHLLVEAVTQLRGEAGDRQVPDAELAMVHGLGGVHMTGATAVLASEGRAA